MGGEETGLQYDLFPEQAHLCCVDAGQGKRRFYRMTVQPTLFGEWVLLREWGRIGWAGQTKCEHFRYAGQAVDALQKTIRRKARRGYCFI